MEEQYEKLLDMIRAVRINVPLVNVLVGMPNYGKFLKELVSNKHKLEQISSTFPSNENFDALLDDESKILNSIDGTLLEHKIFVEFDEFISMNMKENTESKFDEEELTFKKITFDTDYKIKKSLDEPPTDLELKPLSDHLEYAFLEEPSFLPVIISS
ncbi:hypothetical protein Tco_0872301 [Tanacetum coccineum]